MVFTSSLSGRILPAIGGILCGVFCAGGQSPAPVPAPAAPKSAAVSVPPPTRTVADSTAGVAMVQDVLSSLAKYDQEGRPAKQKMGFELPERALNEYLAWSLRNRPRPGVNALTVILLPKNQMNAEAEIDFDAIQKWNPEILPALLRPVLKGRQTMKADVEFESSNGSCSFKLRNTQGPDGKAMVNKIMETLLQALGSQQPESYDTSKPIPLPYGLKRIWTEKQLMCGET